MSVTEHFDRVWRVTLHSQSNRPGFVENNPGFFEEVGTGLEITELRIQFKIVKSLKPEPNPCELTITNLSERTRAECQRYPLRVRIEAGYQNEPRLLYAGDVIPGGALSKLNGTDWETKLLIADGLRSFSNARVDRSYRTGTTVHTILRDIAASMNLQLPRKVDEDPALRATIATSELAMGFSSDELTRILAPYGYNWSIQNGQLQILRDEGVREETERELSIATGMIDSPELGNPEAKGGPPKITVKALLYPELVPGGRVRVRSRAINGLYKIDQVTHDGDSRGDAWYTSVEVRPL